MDVLSLVQTPALPIRQFPQHHLDNLSQGWITGQRSQPDGRVRAEVLHRPVGGIPVQQQGLERRVRLPEQALGEEGVRGGQEGWSSNTLS